MSDKGLIQLACPRCGGVGRGTEAHLQREITCPKCKQTVRLVAVKQGRSQATKQKKEKRPVESQKSAGVSPASSVELEENQIVVRTEAPSRATKKTRKGKRVATRGRKSKESEIDTNLIYVSFVGLVGIVVLGISTFLSWLNFGELSVQGIKVSDGKVVIGVTVASLLIVIIGLAEKRWTNWTLMLAQVWNIAAAIWMGWLIWTIESTLNTGELKDNPLATMMLANIGPGLGLYLGLLGGIVATAMFGFVLFRIASDSKNVLPCVSVHLLGLAIGGLIIFIIEDRQNNSQPIFDIPKPAKVERSIGEDRISGGAIHPASMVQRRMFLKSSVMSAGRKKRQGIWGTEGELTVRQCAIKLERRFQGPSGTKASRQAPITTKNHL